MFKTAIILAGGKSARMGEDKALLPFGDRSLIERMIDELRDHFEDLILVTNHPERFMAMPEVRLVSDVHAGQGPLGGIFSGLLASRGRHNLIVSCDLPFLNHLLLDYLWSLRNWGDVVVPLTHEGLSPMMAIYDRHALAPIAAALGEGQADPLALYAKLRVHYVREDEVVRYDPLLLSFRHVTTPAQYQVALAELAAVTQEAP
jgi:molybdopterin-guanine dinucleotide biosynthesis protein A